MQILSNDSPPKNQNLAFESRAASSRFSSLFNACVKGVGAAAQTAGWVASTAAHYTVKPAAEAVVKNTLGRVADRVVTSYKNDNEKFLAEFTGNGELAAFVHDLCHQFPFLEKTFVKNMERGSATSEEIQSQIILHILATFAKKEEVTCSGPELLGRFASFIETTYQNVVHRSIQNKSDFKECATSIFEELFPELNSGWLFGYPASFAASFLSDFHEAHLAAEELSSNEAQFIPFLRRKLREARHGLSEPSSQENLVSHAKAFIPGASSDFMAEVGQVLFKSSEKSLLIEDVPEPLQLLIPQFSLLEFVAARFMARVVQKIKESDYTFLEPYREAPVEKWPALLKEPVLAYIREEKSIPGFLRNAALGYVENNFESLLMGKYKNQLIKTKRALDAEWDTLISNPLKGSPHEDKARELAKSISEFLLPKSLEGVSAPFEELFLQVLAKQCKDSGEEFGALLHRFTEERLLDIRHLHEKFLINKTVSFGDIKKVLDKISPSIAILYPQSIGLVHGHLMKIMRLTRGLSKTEAASPVVKDLSFLFDYAIDMLQEKPSSLLHGIQLGDTIEPLLVGLKQGLLRITVQISKKNDLQSSLIGLSDLADLYQQKSEGYEVSHLIGAKLDELGIELDGPEIEWLLTTVWPPLKNTFIPIVNIAKSQKASPITDPRSKLFARDIAKFLASKIPFSGISEETKALFIERGVLSMLSAIDPGGILSPLERIDRLSQKWVSVVSRPKEAEALFKELCPLLAPHSGALMKALGLTDIMGLIESLKVGIPTTSFDRFMQKKESQPFSELCNSLVHFATKQIVASWGPMLAPSGVAKGHLLRALQNDIGSIETVVKALLEKVVLSLLERGEKRDPACDSLWGLLVLGVESVTEEIQRLIPAKEDSVIVRQEKIDKILVLVIGDLAKKLPLSLHKIVSSHLDSFLSVLTLWNGRKDKNSESIDSKFSSNNFTYFIDKLSNSWLVGFIPHILKANASSFADSIAKTIDLQNSEGVKTLLILLGEKMGTVSDTQEMSPLRGLLIFFCHYAEGALLQLFSNLFTRIQTEDKKKEVDGGFIFHLMSQGVEKAGHFYEGVFEAGRDLLGRTSDAKILASLQKRNVHHNAQLTPESRDQFYKDISKKLVFATGLPEEEEVPMPKAFLTPSIELLATTLLPIVLKSIEEKTMSPDALDGFVKLLVDKLTESVRNWRSTSAAPQAELILPPGIKRGDLGKVVRNLIKLVPTLAVAPLLELDEISQMTDEKLDAVFISLFHGTDFFTFLSPMIEGIIPLLIGGELVKKNAKGFSKVHLERKDGKPIAPSFETTNPQEAAANRSAKRREIQKQGAALLIRGTEKIIKDKASSLWASIECVFKKIWSYISSAVGTILGEFTGTVSKRVEATRFGEPLRKVGDAIWAFIDFLFSGIILKVLQIAAIVPYWIFKSLMTLYLETKVSVYLDELHRPHHKGVFFHFLEEVVEALPRNAAA